MVANTQDLLSRDESQIRQYYRSNFEKVLASYMFKVGPRREKTCLRGFANNKCADQPAHPHSLISAFVIGFLKSTISKLAASEISIF